MNLVNSIATEKRDLLERVFEQRCKTVYLGEHVALTRVLGELMLYVDTRDVILAPHLLMSGVWEYWVTQAVARHLKPGMVCADVGANVGYYTMLMASLVQNGHVVAFELLPSNCRLLKRSAEINGFLGTVTVHEGAVADCLSEVRILIPQGSDAFSHMANASLASVDSRRAPGEVSQPGIVHAIPLDSIDFGPRLDLIKIDVEGAEPLVWKGSRATRERYNPIVVMEYEAWRADYPAFLAEVRAEGYTVRYVEYDASLVPLPPEPDPKRLYMLWVTK